MIVCSCNVLSDQEIRNVVRASQEQPLSAPQLYDCLGCSIRCGRCARAVKRIISEASTACAERAREGVIDVVIEPVKRARTNGA
jgi:bacterioferritin-associated ferredoxin